MNNADKRRSKQPVTDEFQLDDRNHQRSFAASPWWGRIGWLFRIWMPPSSRRACLF